MKPDAADYTADSSRTSAETSFIKSPFFVNDVGLHL
nr:MAG TPA: hypothetical protein [Caudoviricetes sp.]